MLVSMFMGSADPVRAFIRAQGARSECFLGPIAAEAGWREDRSIQLEEAFMSALSESPLQRTVRTTATEFWNDGPSAAELEYAMANGAVGATSNPFLIFEEMGRDRGTWKARAQALRVEHPAWSIAEVAWALYGEIARRAADTLRPVYDRENGREGYVSVQVDPTQHPTSRRSTSRRRACSEGHRRRHHANARGFLGRRRADSAASQSIRQSSIDEN